MGFITFCNLASARCDLIKQKYNWKFIQSFFLIRVPLIFNFYNPLP